MNRFLIFLFVLQNTFRDNIRYPEITLLNVEWQKHHQHIFNQIYILSYCKCPYLKRFIQFKDAKKTHPNKILLEQKVHRSVSSVSIKTDINHTQQHKNQSPDAARFIFDETHFPLFSNPLRCTRGGIMWWFNDDATRGLLLSVKTAANSLIARLLVFDSVPQLLYVVR